MAPRNSLKSQTIRYFLLSLLITLFSLSVSIYFSARLQTMVDSQFEEETELQELQSAMANLQPLLLEYLSSRSSTSLSQLLSISQNLRSTLPQATGGTRSESRKAVREISFLVEAYLDDLNEIIELKRSRNIDGYTRKYEKMQDLYDLINARIDQASLGGFRSSIKDYQSFISLFRSMYLNNFLLLMLGVFFAFSLLMLSVDRLTSPLQQLSALAGKLSNGDFTPDDVHLKSVYEVNMVAEAFNHMKRSIHHYLKEQQKQQEIEQKMLNAQIHNMKMEQMLKRMELYTMQAQMNPHFLFNTLNTGVQLAILEEADRTADFMDHLANLFRHNLKDQQFFIPLKHEIDGVSSYLEILRIRFPKTREFTLDVEESLLGECKVPSMVIQPLVENSVVHAFKNSPDTGKVDVRVYSEGKFIIMSVRDNGSGIPKSTVKQLLQSHTGEYSITSKVMGLENVIQRCYFFYPGDSSVIQINTAEGEGTEIRIRLNREEEPCIRL